MYDVYFCEGGKGAQKLYYKSHCHPLWDYLLVAYEKIAIRHAKEEAM